MVNLISSWQQLGGNTTAVDESITGGEDGGDNSDSDSGDDNEDDEGDGENNGED